MKYALFVTVLLFTSTGYSQEQSQANFSKDNDHLRSIARGVQLDYPGYYVRYGQRTTTRVYLVEQDWFDNGVKKTYTSLISLPVGRKLPAGVRLIK